MSPPNPLGTSFFPYAFPDYRSVSKQRFPDGSLRSCAVSERKQPNISSVRFARRRYPAEEAKWHADEEASRHKVQVPCASGTIELLGRTASLKLAGPADS